MPNRAIVALKVLVWIACLYPVARLVYGFVTNNLGPDPTHTVTFATGLAGLRLLIISLAITPVRRILPKLSWLIRFRRLLGLFAFFYITLHLLTYVVLYSSFDFHAMYADILKKRYITAGIAAWVLLVPLALTSTKWSIKKLGKRWQTLHRLVYVAACLGITHFWWQVKPGALTPLNTTLVFFAIMLARPVTQWFTSRRRTAVAAAR